MQPTLSLWELQNDATTAPQAAPTTAPAATGTDASTTPPAQAPASPLGGMTSLLPLVLIFAVFYFVLIGPERKARKKREAMLKEIGKGDEVLTTSGMFATVVSIQDDQVTLQISDGVRARFARSAIQSVVESKKSGDSGKSSDSGKPAESAKKS